LPCMSSRSDEYRQKAAEAKNRAAQTTIPSIISAFEISSRSQTQARKVARELLKRADTIVKHAQTGTTPLELARVCKAWARVPAGIANARARSVAGAAPVPWRPRPS